MEKFNILLVDDEISYFEILQECEDETLSFYYASSGEEVKSVLEKENINLILMDWNIGQTDGLELVKELNNHYRIFNIPVIMVTAKIGEQNMVNALDSGADDYVAKPFSLKLLRAKIKANLRKTESRLMTQGGDPSKQIDFDDNKLSVTINKKELLLRKKEYLILKFLFSNPDRCFTRSELNRLTSGRDVYISDRCIDTYVRYLRTKLKDDLEIKTVRGQGYRAKLKVCVQI